ncbi:hypothetical protein GCM10009716_16290 [Streptomyces sodiiphilus]|uniref:Uncharacterized protein n=1 Tax=Streptomyces sodiiphilus TaxID=226217 RepID=A0ABN2NYC9_9ACTN
MHPPLRLVVADHVAGSVTVLEPDGGTVVRLTGRHLSEHAGLLRLPGDRLALVDDRAGELVVLDVFGDTAGRPAVSATVPVAVPAEQLAADPAGRRLAVTTGLGANAEPWSDVCTVVDLEAPGGAAAVRFRTRAGEPGVTLPGSGDPLVVLRHREPGFFESYRFSDLLATAPGCPPAEPLERLALPDDGHGDAHDPAGGLLFAATGEGVHRARPEGSALRPEPPLSWDASGRTGGRGYFLRLDTRHRVLWSCLRGGPTDPGQWPLWTNDAWWHRLDTGETGRLEIGPGLVFRMGLAARHAAFARCHPDGDELVLVSTDLGTPAVSARLPLPAMDGAPRRGGTPWDGVQRRAVAASPAASLVAVTRGGHGEIQLFDAGTATVTGLLRLPTPLDEGGRLAVVAQGDDGHLDPAGR